MTTYDALSTMDKILLDGLGGEAVVAVRPSTVRALRGNGNAAILLSQGIYWQKRTQNRDGFWYNTQGELENQTGLGSDAQKSAREMLTALGLWEEVRRDRNALHYRVNLPAVIALLITQREKDERKRPAPAVSDHDPKLDSGHGRKLTSGHAPKLVSGANSTGETSAERGKNAATPPGNSSLYKIPSEIPSLSQPALEGTPPQGEGEKKIEVEKSPEEYIQEQPELEALWVRWVEAMEFKPKSKIRGPQATAFLAFKSIGALTRALEDTLQNFEGLQLPFKYLTARYEEQVKSEPQPLKSSAGAAGGAEDGPAVREGQRWLSNDLKLDRVFIVDALIRNPTGKVVQAESYQSGKLSIADLTRDYRLAE